MTHRGTSMAGYGTGVCEPCRPAAGIKPGPAASLQTCPNPQPQPDWYLPARAGDVFVLGLSFAAPAAEPAIDLARFDDPASSDGRCRR